MRISAALETRPAAGRRRGAAKGTRLNRRAYALPEGNGLTGRIAKEVLADPAGATLCRNRPELRNRRCLSGCILGLRAFGTAYPTVPPDMIEQTLAAQWSPQP